MRKVIGIGETVLDIIFKDEGLRTGEQSSGFQPIAAVPGGSVFNGIISLGRSGVPTSFISETGNDRVGKQIIRFLEDNGVDARSINVYPDSKSPVSLAFLNEQNDAEYIFYKDHPRDRLDFDYPSVEADDIVMFGSFYAVNPVIRPQVKAFLDYASNKGAILYYDVNFRSSHKNDVMRITPNLLENFELADIVRGSAEDFEVLFRKTDANTVYRSQIAFYTKNFIYTQGASQLELRAEGNISKQYPVEQMATVSTIGAGDNFNAGFVYGLIKYGITREMIEEGFPEELWDQLIRCAQQYAANVCKSISNSVDPAFGAQMKQEMKQFMNEQQTKE